MKRKIINFSWEDEDAQKVFAEWIPFPDARTSAKEVDTIESFVGLEPPKLVLDIGCGNGRHAFEFANRGYKIIGIDIAKQFLNEAKKTARNVVGQVEFRLQRATELTERNVFDFALAYWHTIGFMSDDEIKNHFASIYNALKTNCVFLYTFQGPKLLSGQELSLTIPIKTWSEKNGMFILTEKSIQNGFREELCTVINTNTNEIIEYREHQRAMRYEEVIDYLMGAGFSSVDGFKNFDGELATPEEFYIFLCKKT